MLTHTNCINSGSRPTNRGSLACLAGIHTDAPTRPRKGVGKCKAILISPTTNGQTYIHMYYRQSDFQAKCNHARLDAEIWALVYKSSNFYWSPAALHLSCAINQHKRDYK